jgi:hypothetical protein
LVPDDADVEVLRSFLSTSLATYDLIVAQGRLRRSDRQDLRSLAEDFQAHRVERLIGEYAETSDEIARDAGVFGAPLRSKANLSANAAQNLDQSRVGRGDISTRAARRWIKRVKVLVGSLKSLIPGAEAFIEMLDLLNAALDR